MGLNKRQTGRQPSKFRLEKLFLLSNQRHFAYYPIVVGSLWTLCTLYVHVIHKLTSIAGYLQYSTVQPLQREDILLAPNTSRHTLPTHTFIKRDSGTTFSIKAFIFVKRTHEVIDKWYTVARLEKAGSRLVFSQIDPNWPLPYITVPVPLLRDARPAGWVNCFSIRESTMPSAQNRAGKGSILKEDKMLCRSGYIIYLCMWAFDNQVTIFLISLIYLILKSWQNLNPRCQQIWFKKTYIACIFCTLSVRHCLL